MDWSKSLKTVKRGFHVATGIVKAELPRLQPPPVVAPTPGGWIEIARFGSNPGRLRMLAHVPGRDVSGGRPLIVLLHGCGQTAMEFAVNSGWVALAERAGIPLVLPEQAAENNSGRCFQWFQPADATREHGEAGSIAAMTRTAIERFRSDPSQVFVVDLSAGGAMAAALLAAYPDMFAGGAVVAGLPVGAAASAMQALLRMASAAADQRPANLAEAARQIGPGGYAGPWPRLSIWHGDADDTVAPDNGLLLATQWRTLHKLPERPQVDTIVGGGVRHRVWGDAVELWTLPGMAHGYPVGDGAGTPAPFMLPESVPATPRIADFLGVGDP